MFKKAILSAFAAVALLFAANAPANAAMAVAKPEAAKSVEASQIVKVGRRGGGGFHRGGFRHHGGWRPGRWHGHHWHHKRYWYWGRYWASPWAWYRHCRYLQRHGRRIACPRPYY